jgi:hypothetical protein
VRVVDAVADALLEPFHPWSTPDPPRLEDLDHSVPDLVCPVCGGTELDEIEL